MSKLENKIKENSIFQKSIFKFGFPLFMATFVVYLGSFFCAPFNDWDVSFYPVIGRGIFEHYMLPYNYAFDHKPYLTYVFYYLWCRLEPFVNGRFTLLALTCAGLASYFLGKVYGINKWKILFCLSIFSAFSNFLDGNTEVIQIVLISIFVYLIIKSCTSKDGFSLFCAGFVFSIASNVNYLSGFILTLVSVAFFISSSLSVRRVLWFIFGIVSSLFIIFLPFLLSGNGCINEYFSMQHHFIHNYASNLMERLEGILYLVCDLLFLSPVIFLWVKEKYYSRNIKYKILSVWFIAAVLATSLSGHSYTHYFSLLYVPSILMLVILYNDGKFLYRYTLIPLVLYVEVSMILVVISNINSMKHTREENPKFIANVVGHHKVLNINSDHALYYLANLEPFEKFSFQGQMETYYKNNYNEVYMADLIRGPEFVILPYRGCSSHVIDKNICDFIFKNYKLNYVSYNKKSPEKVSGRYYELYELIR
ncbi:MAG: hypothetical protein ABF636_09890 [Acetobacter sp.]